MTGDDVELGGGLSVLCPASDKPCRQDAKEVVLAMVNELQNPYTGQGIVSTGSLSVPNTLPLVMSADRDFNWAQAGGGEKGTTKTVVLDLGPLLATPPTVAYAIVTTPDGIPHRFVIDAASPSSCSTACTTLPVGHVAPPPATPPPGT